MVTVSALEKNVARRDLILKGQLKTGIEKVVGVRWRVAAAVAAGAAAVAKKLPLFEEVQTPGMLAKLITSIVVNLISEHHLFCVSFLTNVKPFLMKCPQMKCGTG